MIGKAIKIAKARGIAGLMRAIHSRLRNVWAVPRSSYSARSFQIYKNQFTGKAGIEIGGPSQVFSKSGIFPVYPIAGSLDNCNFGNTTVWEGAVESGRTFQFDRKKPAGQQYIAEATEMIFLDSGTYDFVLSSHVLEHIANPILALSEWMRLLRNRGIMVLLLPNKDKTFDHRRPVTTLEHLIEDFQLGVAEDDLTHLPEILTLHDLARDPAAGSAEAFKARSMLNFENRCLHHHVFDTRLAVDLLRYTGWKVLAAEELEPLHILLMAQKDDGR